MGGTASVPTLNGGATINVPEGTPSAQKFRLKGKGVPAAGQHSTGDLYAVIQIHPPKRLNDRSKELLKEFQELNP